MRCSLVPLLSALLLFPVIFPATGRGDVLDDLVDQHYPWAAEPGPGMLVGVWEGESAVYQRQLGYRDLDLDPMGQVGAAPVAMSFASPMRIASITKSFTVTRVLQLAAAGEFAQGLDTPISAFEGMAMPGGRPVFSTAGLLVDPLRFDAGNPVTLRHLAAMTSSYADYSATPEMQQGLNDDITTAYSPDQLVAFAVGKSPTTAPWHYSNTNTLLLGMIVEAVTGNDLGSELQTHLFTPAGLTQTLYPATNAVSADFAHGYGSEPDGSAFFDLTEAHPSIAAGSGGMISDFDDLRRWAKVVATGELASGDSLYGPGDFSDLHAERLAMVDADGPGPHYDRYGLGIGEIEGWIGHTGEFLGYQHLMMYDAENDRTIVIMMNAAGFADGRHVPVDLFTDLAGYYAIPEPTALLWIAAGGALLFRRGRRGSSARLSPGALGRMRG